MPVELTSKHRKRGVQAGRIRAEAERLLCILGIDSELSVALIGDDEMQSLNARFRGKDRPTDVLAFPMEAQGPPVSRLLGDVVISIDTAARQAAERNVEITDEIRVLLVHGVLHLIGYDHERSPAEARRMFAKQRQVVGLLGENGF